MLKDDIVYLAQSFGVSRVHMKIEIIFRRLPTLLHNKRITM